RGGRCIRRGSRRRRRRNTVTRSARERPGRDTSLGVALIQTGDFYVEDRAAWHVSLLPGNTHRCQRDPPKMLNPPTLQALLSDSALITRGRALAVEMGAPDEPPTMYAAASCDVVTRNRDIV
ncbi:hypothetical protein KIPB_008175, partial [Kipferlia bialata]